MKNLLITLGATSMVICAMSAVAEETGGDLQIETTVGAVCTVDIPDEKLVLPVSAAASLDNQPFVSTAMTVTVTCSGGASVKKVIFDKGRNRGTLTGKAASVDPNTRYLINSNGPQSNDRSFLGYKVFVSNGSNGVDPSNDQEVGTDDLAGNNVFEPTTTIETFQIIGRIFEKQRGVHGSAADIPFGTYQDTITMTVDYR
jgi:spore coat protein U-like protein